MGQSSGKQNKVTKHDIALLKIKCLRDSIKIFLYKAECIIKDEQDITRKLLKNGHREKAKSLLRRKLTLQNYLKGADEQLENVEKIIFRLESTQMERKVIDALTVGNVALKNANNIMDIKYIKRILLETSEGIKKQMEIEEKVSALHIPVSERELEHELEIVINGNQETNKNQVTSQGREQSLMENLFSSTNNCKETNKILEKPGPSKGTAVQDESIKKPAKLTVKV